MVKYKNFKQALLFKVGSIIDNNNNNGNKGLWHARCPEYSRSEPVGR